MNLRQFDQNLWLVLDALYQTQSVSGAAKRLNLSQSAISHALKRLRTAFNDPLFVREDGKMLPTQKAQNIQSLTQQGLEFLNQVANGLDSFCKSTSNRQFVVAATDFTTKLFIYPLLNMLSTLDCNIRIKVIDLSSEIPIKALSSNHIDLVLTFSHGHAFESNLSQKKLISGQYRVIARKQHPIVSNELSLEAFLSAKHVLVSPWGASSGSLDNELEKLGKQRHIAATVPQLMNVVELVSNSDLIATVPAVSIKQHEVESVQILEPPLPLPDYNLFMVWHPSYNLDQGLIWLRSELETIATQILEGFS
ncbi:LysR family transcriptional regulator [Pseudoalteromonas luteoviolacea]|uniref:LysR family transcriptional regulator n=1 Tax=Pseudoalteromonas luteoviolacea TaxID=43657 RepID=UPI001B36AAFE|nr:LysR family transcriptional regulator [Pseudoalteromonas luteoviolacea]MBQ4809910.1 LysR family transcriptional regulator [Pseudoalteromonas luteoviolacea]